jgi:hypothetical protein
MKCLGVLIAGIMLSSAAHAIDDSEFRNSGEFRVRYFNDHMPEYNQNGDQTGSKKSDTGARFRWNMSVRKGERLQAYLGVIHNTQFGGQGDQATPGTDAFAINDANNLLLVNRAWGWWRGSDAISFKVGRMGIEFGDGSVFSENDWEAIPTAHEGIGAAVDMEYAQVSFFALKTDESSVLGGDGDPERNFYLVTADVKNLPEVAKVANIHFIQVMRDRSGSPTNVGNQNWQHIGFTVGGDYRNFIYKGTAAFQTGTFDQTATSDLKLSTNMFDLMVGYTMPEMMGAKVSFGYHSDSGDDSDAGTKGNYQSLYYDRHNYGGLMDVFRWGNLSYWNVNASFMAKEDLEVGAGFYVFSRSSAAGETLFGDRFDGYESGVGFAASETDLGSELDLYANKSYDSGFKIGSRFGMFMPGKYLTEGSPKRDQTLYQVMVQASMAF